MLKVAKDMESKPLSESASSEVLGREECLRLLASQSLGRLAINLRSEVPMIRPVNYVFDERTQSIVFRTDFGSKLQGILITAKAAFEVDSIDAVRRTGWSVIVTGAVEKVSNHLELERFENLELRPWEPGEKPHWARIRVWTITGRRIVPGH
jgi:nitroimidazol reductase NimA-like FMN-containing flavoprotein (pyridoxamine 5'-phosphate oxidase superfamily)